MARRVARVRFARPAPRTKMWIGWGVGNATVVASTVKLLFTYSAGALLLRPFTILRTRGIIAIKSDQEAASEFPFGSFGELIVTDTAAALGITALPNPDSFLGGGDPEADWYIHQVCQVDFVRSASGLSSPAASEYMIDSKAMRKVGPDDDGAALFAPTGVGCQVFTGGRQLIQLH